MKNKFIKNFGELATTENRALALFVMEAGYEAINTQEVIKNQVRIDGDVLYVKGESFDLKKFKNIKVVGFGKASPEAAFAIEKIFDGRIKEGAVIGLHKAPTEHIETFAGSHPVPSIENIVAGKRIYEIADSLEEDDLLIVLVSGGGSALLTYPENECTQGAKLYSAFLQTGETISELNTIRKHLSFLKGGGLAKIAYPATVISLIFSDVPGHNYENVASGPTYKDITTAHEAKELIKKYNLGDYEVNETPKEDKYFSEVHNYVLVSNDTALVAMSEKARELGFDVEIITSELYDEVETAIKKIASKKSENKVILAGGEPRITVQNRSHGKGGRNLHMGLTALDMGITGDDSVFISFASDGMDNSDSAGAIVDGETKEKFSNLGIDTKSYLNNFDSYSAFLKSKDMIVTGATGSNVSDLMIFLARKN